MARFETGGAEFEQMGASGNPAVLLELGLIYATGRNGEQDFVTAHKWFNLAAHRGCSTAKAYRDDLATEMSKTDIVAAQKAAREWLTRH